MTVSVAGVVLSSARQAFGQQQGSLLEVGRFDEKISALGKSLQGNLLTAQDPAFDGMRRPGSFNLLTDKKPLLIAQCRSASDIARSIEFARLNDLELAVKSGGHDVMGQSTCAGGVLIDLGLMQDVTLDSASATVRAGAGVRGGQLDYVLSESDLIVPLACHPGVSVSGLTLGGGLGWLLGNYGTTADSVAAMEVVTADGRQLRATESQNEDLFWALRGGGGNFGVVSAIEYRVHPLGQVTGGFLVYPLDRLAEYLHFFRETMASAPDELTIELSIAPTSPPLLVATVCHCGDEAQAQSVLDPIRKFGAPLFDGIRRTKLRELSIPSKEAQDFIKAYTAQASATGSGQADATAAAPVEESDGHFNHWRGASIGQWTDAAIEMFTSCLEQAPPGWSMGIGHYMHGAPCRVAPEAAPQMRDEHLSSYFFNVSWRHSSQSSEVMAWVDQSISSMQPFNGSGTYVNYLSSNTAEAVADSYGQNYPRLQRLKSRYDPDNVFHLNRNIRA